jgi:hypothetical protein
MTYWLVYHDLAVALLGRLQSEISLDPERLYVTGLSMGGMVSWAMLARYPDLFAAGVPICGSWYFTNIWQQYLRIRSPVWSFHAANDGAVPVAYSDDAITQLRRVGQNPIYTRYASGGHGSWIPAYGTPGLVDWVMAQRRGQPSTNQPLLTITSPTVGPLLTTAATNLALAGSAAALGQNVTRVTCSNLTYNLTASTSGTYSWTAPNVPLRAGNTNLITVTAATTSWASAYGGETTFSEALTVLSSPIRASLALGATGTLLNWTGGTTPFQVERATELTPADWIVILTNATPPVALPVGADAEYYRVAGP